MKIHSCKPHVFLALVIALALALFNGVARPDRPVSVSAEKVAQLAGIPDPGVECGCKKTGEFVKPARGALPEVVYTDLDSGTSPGGIYALNASGTAASTTITIRHIADNVQILSISGPGGQWGFSPDDHRFVHWYTSGANIVVKLYNLQAPDGQELVLLINLPVSDVQIRFSPNGYYLFLSRLIDADTTQLFLYHARDGEQRYTQVINFTVIPGGDGDQFGMASYGFSPDVMDRRFVYAYASGQSSVPWKMIDLKTGEVLLQRTFTGSSAFWNFSRCGDRLGIIDETTTNQYRIQLYDTLDAALIFDQVVSAALTLTLTTTENEHLAYTGSSPYSLGDNTAYANCAVIGVNALVLEKEAAVGGATVNGEIVLSGPAPAGGRV